VDKLVGVKDANLHQTDFTYYATGELKSETAPGDPATRRLLYTYYPGGQLKEKRRDADGDGEVGSGDQVILSFTYNPDGKLAGKTDHLTGETTTFTYYPVGQAHAGLLQSAASPAVTYTFDYFDNGWLKSVTDNSGRVIRYDAYDALGRRELMTLLPGTPEEKVLDYVYDGQKRLEQIVSAAGTFTFGYDAWGRRETLTYPGTNGIIGTYTYNGQTDWLTGITYKEGATGPELLAIVYPEHDKVGNRKTRTEDNVATTYTYDDVYQLRQAKTGAAEENFAYDAVGNRESGPTVKDTATAAYDHDDANRMLEGRKFDYAYDDFGNQQFRYLDAAHTKFWQYTWDGENRLTKAELKKGAQVVRTVTFKYDPFGRRIEKKVVDAAGTVTRTYVYDGEDIALEYVSDGTTTTLAHTIHGPGIDEPLARVSGGQSTYYHADGLGNVVAITDASKAIVQRYGYESFGMLTVSHPAFENAYTYTGREWDKETGLYYYRARYYDPMEGRFVSRDPIAFAGGDVNLYGYVSNNPIDWTDPYGLFELFGKEINVNAGGGLQAGVQAILIGLNGSVGGVGGTDGQRCGEATICFSLGPGIYAGGGVYGAVGGTSGNTSNVGGWSIGGGGDAGWGQSVGGQGTIGPTSVRYAGPIPKVKYGGGWGANAGVDFCYTFTFKCTECPNQ
jgi:RHS repeat-associated protein